MLVPIESSNSVGTVAPGSNETSKERLFDPPLYKQRYDIVAEVIKNTGAKHVMDMGCSEGQFLTFVKDMCPNVEVLYGVDIDRHLLEKNSHRIKPFTIEYLIKRVKPLTISLLHGSITQPDLTYFDIDFVCCIEVIEHLYEDDLRKVPSALFGSLQPKTVVMTTPNSEYNVLFKDFSGMRHWDHKFEWSRNEFQNWCENIVSMYPTYSVKYDGVGKPPLEQKDVGFCSQLAVFSRNNISTTKRTNLATNPIADVAQNVCNQPSVNEITSQYVTIETVVYPIDKRSREEKISNEISYFINHYFSNIENETDEEFCRIISIAELKKLVVSSCQELCDITEKEFKNILMDAAYELSKDGENVIVEMRLADYWSDGDDLYDAELSELNHLVEEFCITEEEEEEEEEWV